MSSADYSTRGAVAVVTLNNPPVNGLSHVLRGAIVAGLDQAAVSVNFQQQVERGVLSVPVTALLATPGGGYAVQTVNQAGVHKLVPVSPGLFAGGFVQVSGSDLVEGMQVTDSQG